MDKKQSQHSPGPWKACHDGKCQCKTVWSTVADHPVAEVTAGKWGDHFASLRLVGGRLEQRVEAFTDLIDYGEVEEKVAIANARLITAAPTMYDYLEKRAEMGDSEAQVILEKIFPHE